MKLFDLKIVIENLRGSYKKFADTLDEYPILGVTFPVHYGYIDGYVGEDTQGLDVFVGSGDMHGIMRVNRNDVVGGIETKIIMYVTEEEFEEVKEIYKLVTNKITKVSEEEIINLLPNFLDKTKKVLEIGNLDIKQNGIILYTPNFEAIVAFYTKVFKFPKLFDYAWTNGKLVCLNMGTSYLMIETKEIETHKSEQLRIRFNVKNIDSVKDLLFKLKVVFEYKTYDWGEVVDLKDPDGNTISIRDEKKFQDKINDHNHSD